MMLKDTLVRRGNTNKQMVDLSSVPAFQNLPGMVTTELSQHVRQREIRRGTVLFNQFDPIHHVYLVHTGAMRLVQYTPDGQAVSLALFCDWDFFGLLEAVQQQPAMGSAEAMKDTVLLSFKGEHFRSLIQKHPALSAVVTEHLTAYLFNGYERIRELSTMRVEARLANSVVRLVDKFGMPVNGYWEIDLPLSRQGLAELVGTRLETVSRIVRGWEHQGIVMSKRESLTVLVLDELAEIAAKG